MRTRHVYSVFRRHDFILASHRTPDTCPSAHVCLVRTSPSSCSIHTWSLALISLPPCLGQTYHHFCSSSNRWATVAVCLAGRFLSPCWVFCQRPNSRLCLLLEVHPTCRSVTAHLSSLLHPSSTTTTIDMFEVIHLTSASSR